jgi:predicted thioesterase
VTDTSVVLENLVKPGHVQVASTTALAGAVADAAAKDDKERLEDGREPVRRKPELRRVPAVEVGQSVTVTPWEVLHALGRATVLSRQGAGRGLAEHWGCLKYCQALEGSSGKYMKLSEW